MCRTTRRELVVPVGASDNVALYAIESISRLLALAKRHQSAQDYYRGASAGMLAELESVVHSGAVMIIPLRADGTVVMERRWRDPLGQAFIEFLAGKIDEGEAPRVTCERELREETGYAAERLTSS